MKDEKEPNVWQKMKNATSPKRIKEVRALKKAKEYDQILELYGQDAYRVSVPRKLKKQEIDEFMENGRFEDIYRKYGSSEYNKLIYLMQQREVYLETGSKSKSIFNRVKNVIAHRILPYALSLGMLIPATGVATLNVTTALQKEEDAEKYAVEINNDYLQNKEYAEQIKGMNLTDTQIFMKLMDDMWAGIKGYKTPENEVSSYLRLSLDEEGVGVCRNFADDITAKLNLINPEYNARNVNVYMESREYSIANIKRNNLEVSPTYSSEETENENETENKNGFDITKITGNHAVTMLDIPGKNITVVLDPTNPGIGVLKDGKIHMFSTEDGKGISYRAFTDVLFEMGEAVNRVGEHIKSYFDTDLSIDELKEIYGLEAQNEALEYVRKLGKEKNTYNDFCPQVEVDEEMAVAQTRKAEIKQGIAEMEENNIAQEIETEKEE